MFDELLENVMNLGIITEDDVERLTAVELMLLIIERTNGLLLHVNNVDGKMDTLLEDVNKITIDELNKWTQDGTFDSLINQSTLKKVNARIDETNTQLSHITKGTEIELINVKYPPLGVKQAMGDGITDDREAIQQCVDFMKNSGADGLYFPKGDYLIDGNLTFPSGYYYSDLSATIVANSFVGEHFIKNENNKINSELTDTLVFENITFKMGVYGGEMNGVLVGMFNTENSMFKNCCFKSDENNTNNTWGIDLYSNNKNCLIDNCKFDLLGNGRFLTTSISIREYSSSKVTENITVRNCIIKESGIDENLWISEWNGELRNIIIEGTTIKEIGTSESIILLGGCENLIFKDCIIEVDELKGRLLTAETKDGVKQSVTIENCTFTVNELVANSTIMHTTAGVGDIVIRNNTFSVPPIKNSFNVDGINAYCRSEGNTFFGKFGTVMQNVKYSLNDDLSNCVGTLRNMKDINNIKYNSIDDYFITLYSNDDTSDLNIENSSITCKQLVQFINPKVGKKINIRNCNITKKEWQLVVSTKTENVDGFELNIADTNVNSNTFRFVDKNYIKVSSSNLTVNHMPYKGIPDNGIDREAVKVGSVFLSDTNGKIIVRKITEGSTTDCWEII